MENKATYISSIPSRLDTLRLSSALTLAIQTGCELDSGTVTDFAMALYGASEEIQTLACQGAPSASSGYRLRAVAIEALADQLFAVAENMPEE